MAVTKYAEWEWVEALAGFHSVFGENRPQQLAERAPKLPKVEWHLIGQLQRNKVRQAIEHANTIHSVDSVRLLERIAHVAATLNKRPKILLQVNVSGEESKSGFRPDDLCAAWSQITDFQQHVDLSGLMTMAPATEDPEAARPTFSGLASLRDKLMGLDITAECGIKLSELSMGMSGDFETAIEFGATEVRVGSAVFGERVKPSE